MECSEIGICFHRGPFGKLEGGSFIRGFGRWMKAAVEVEGLLLRNLCEESMEGYLLYWGHRRIEYLLVLSFSLLVGWQL
jgi:hypothetical protein